MFLQIHTLTSYHPTLLNRDDAGLAKRIPFGDKPRLRISSQCLKRHWREALGSIVDLPTGTRTRQFFRRIVLSELVESGVNEVLAEALVKALVKRLIEGGVDEKDPLALKQAVLFGRPEADFLVKVLAECAQEGDEVKALGRLEDRLKVDKKNFKAMLSEAGFGNLFAGVEGAMFGRFVTSDILARSDAAVHVEHAMTVHALDTEVDYFTVVDDLNRDDETGAAHAGDMELGAGVYYGYVVIDIPLLVSNFTGCEPSKWRDQDAAEVLALLRAFVRTIATVSPGAKLGATAPYAYSDFVLLEVGTQQPRSLANAYLRALPLKGDVIQTAVDALSSHLKALDAMYGTTVDFRALATTKAWPTGAPKLAPEPLDEVVGTSLAQIFGGQAHGNSKA
jgi:CRISPR system Cascade subunit CasC